MVTFMHVTQDPRMALKNILSQNDEASGPPRPARTPVETRNLECLQNCLGTSGVRDALTNTPSPTASTVSAHDEPHDRWGSWQVQTPRNNFPPEGMERKPRAPRPSYSEEQKFYIMFCRIMCDQSWPEIEDGYTSVFGGRTKGGLTSIYYRVRKDWGMCEVLKSGPESILEDQNAVTRRASHFSTEFLDQIGYLAKDPRYSHYQRDE